MTTVVFKVERVSLTPNHRLVDQASVFMSSRDRVVQLYPRTLVSISVAPLTTSMDYVGTILVPGHHRGNFP